MERTLVCVLAETRAHSISWKSFKTNLLDSSRADLLLCISVPDDYDFSNPFWQFARYKKAVAEFADWGEAFDEAQQDELAELSPPKLSNWRVLLDVKDQWLGGVKGQGEHPGSAGILIYFRWMLLQFLRQEGLLERYDRFIVTRSDFVWESPHPPLSCLDPSCIWIPDGEGYGGLSERHAVLSRENVVDYLNIMAPILREPERLLAQMKGRAGWNLEKFIDFSLSHAGRRDSVRFFPYIMYGARQWGAATRWSRGVWSDQLGHYIKYPAEFQSAESAKRIFKDRQHWLDFFHDRPGIGFNARVRCESGHYLVKGGEGSLVAVAADKLLDQSAVLLVDYLKDEGFLYLGRSGFGACEKQLVDVVRLVPEGNAAYRLVSRKDGRNYALSTDGRLLRSAAPGAAFTFERKYDCAHSGAG